MLHWTIAADPTPVDVDHIAFVSHFHYAPTTFTHDDTYFKLKRHNLAILKKIYIFIFASYYGHKMWACP